MEKKKPKIEIKPQNVGLFTEYCKGKWYKGVTDECISEGLASRDSAVRKRAQFAKNSKSWN